VARTRSPARLILALSVAGVLAIFLVYVAIAGGGTPQLQPSELRGRTGEVVLTGKVVHRTVRDLPAEGVRFRLRDREGTTSILVRYPDTPPDQFKAGRELYLRGELRNGVFLGKPGSMVTKCPSKYSGEKQADPR
jgi:cytochrome c-type biogenesis protein CcmE